MLETQACQTRDCPGNAVVPVSRQCPPTKVCPDQEVVLATQDCGTQLCPGNAVIPASEQCPSTQVCPDNSVILASEVCQSRKCPDGRVIPAGQQCARPEREPTIAPPPQATKKCPGGEVIAVDQQCPTCLSCRFFPLTGDTAPYWAALATLVAIMGGGSAAAAKGYRQYQRARLVAKTAELLSISSSLDPSEGEFQSSGLTVDGPSVRLRAYLNPGES
jgi:hypothetical protein